MLARLDYTWIERVEGPFIQRLDPEQNLEITPAGRKALDAVKLKPRGERMYRFIDHTFM